MNKKRGAIYLAFGNSYLVMALFSIRTLKIYNPNLPICIVTNINIDKSKLISLGKNDTIIYLNENESKNRSIKTSINKISPFEKTIFLDCDTIIMGNLDMGFNFLQYFDVALRLNPYPQKRKGKGDVKLFDGMLVGDCPHWNSGVVFFNNSLNSKSFFSEWRKFYEKMNNKYDQVSLVKVIFQTQAKVLSLDSKWNASDPIINRKKWKRDTIVFHYASNISNKLREDLIDESIRLSKHVPGIENDLRSFIHNKRRGKLIEHGFIKYTIARLIWLFSHI